MGGSTLRTLICALALAGAVSAQRHQLTVCELLPVLVHLALLILQLLQHPRVHQFLDLLVEFIYPVVLINDVLIFINHNHIGNHHLFTALLLLVIRFVSLSPGNCPAHSTSAVLVKPTAALATPSSQTSDVVPDLTSSTDDQPSATDSAKSNVNAASSGFWGNKGAVGATFAVVALVVIGALLGFIAVLRRRAAKHNSARDTFFDTKNPIDQAERQPSPEPSMRSLGNEPMDAHATPMANYGHTDQYLVDTTDYNVSYPPGAAYVADPNDSQQYYTGDYTDPSAQQQQQQQYYQTGDQHYPDQGQAQAYYAENNAYENYNQHYAADPGTQAQANGYSVSPANQRPSLSPHPYSHPSHASASAVPPAMRDLAGRDSYQPSIDSFYGAAGTAL
ncbi:hypothetical protein DFH06DRAFT_1314790 [Mycena polygramma]|nr:hypothetical protein DFH06DRAFT_1314790 [Mycena polygramma]